MEGLRSEAQKVPVKLSVATEDRAIAVDQIIANSLAAISLRYAEAMMAALKEDETA